MPEVPPKPMIMMRACITCGRPVQPPASRCKEHGGAAWAGKPRNRALEYRTAEYRANRKIVLQREPVCHWQFPGCTGKSTQADHLVPIAQGVDNSLDNLVGACGRCNALRGASLGGRVTKARRKEGGKR